MIQFIVPSDPFDLLVITEILHDIKPDLIIETGTNSGGFALYMAVLMEAINPACQIFTMDVEPVEYWVSRFGDGPSSPGGGGAGSDVSGGGSDGGGGSGGGGGEGGNELGAEDPRANPYWKRDAETKTRSDDAKARNPYWKRCRDQN